jgi:hypothetical protein
MVYFRELPVPLAELDPAFVDVFFNFANTYTEESVKQWYSKQNGSIEVAPKAEMFRQMGYSEEEIAGMDL